MAYLCQRSFFGADGALVGCDFNFGIPAYSFTKIAKSGAAVSPESTFGSFLGVANRGYIDWFRLRSFFAWPLTITAGESRLEPGVAPAKIFHKRPIKGVSSPPWGSGATAPFPSYARLL